MIGRSIIACVIIVSAILSFVYCFEDMNPEFLANYLILKSAQEVFAEKTCNYSLALYSQMGAGALVSSATVVINDQPLAGSTNLPFPVTAGVLTYNFTVKQSDIISVNYTFNFPSFINNFKVFSGPGGTGQQIVFSPTMLVLESITNPCTSVLCTYSLMIQSDDTNSAAFSVYVEGVAAIYNLPSPEKGSVKWQEFNISQSDELQLLSSFPYTNGGQFGFKTAFYEAPNFSSTMIWSFVMEYKGAPATTPVPNFCGKTNLKLNLSDFDYTPGQESIGIAVVPTFLASTQFPVNLYLVCKSQFTLQTRLSSLNINQKFDFNTSSISDARGCYFVAASNNTTNYPYSNSQRLYIPFTVSFVLPSQTEVYKQGGSLPILLTTSDSSVTSATVALNCSGQLSTKSVKTETISYMTVPIGLFNTCTVTMSGLSSLYIATNSTITIKTTEFAPPLGPGMTIIPKDQQSAVIQTFYAPGQFVQSS